MKFIDRFSININLEEARRRFVNRVYNIVFYEFYLDLQERERYKIHREIVTALGDKYDFYKKLTTQISDDFYRNLLALETLYKSVDSYDKNKVNSLVVKVLDESEIDLGVRWENGRFVKSGAKLLDDSLVNDTLHWLRSKEYISVIDPFEKGLKNYLHADHRPELLSDVITDMYESLEALSKIVTKRPDKDLAANRELFISKVNASPAYKKILSEYIDYANAFRHAVEEGKAKPEINKREVESFIYITGLFMRLAI